jgi:general nucleoside transport system ATP-binding protein
MDGLRLGVEHVTRAFGPVVANDDVSLSVRRGTVHAVVGENGAGKSTLMRILYGLDQPDSGSVLVDGRAVRLRGPAHGLALGIGIVQQELALVPELTLLENLVLGAEPRRGPFVDWDAARRRAGELADEAGVRIDWSAPAAEAPISIQQQVEVLRLLHRGADVLILDEPTAVLAPAQVDDLLRLLRGLREGGRTVLFISHKLDEVIAIADEITVLRGGRSVATVAASDVDRDRLAELIVGAHVPATRYEPARDVGEPVLRVDGLCADDDHRTRRLDGVSLDVRAGEIVGVAGVAGNGQDELVDCVVGLRRCHAGTVAVRGRDVTHAGVAAHRAAGMAYVSADRKGEGLVLDGSLVDNGIAGFHRGPLARHGWLSAARVRDHVTGLLDRYGVRPGSLRAPARTLSGGNQQRLVFGREMSHEPAVLVASQPTRGVDVKGIAYLHGELRRLRDAGAAVLLVSEELDELLALADRIVVLYRGRVAGVLPGGTDRARLGQLMLGGAA